ncbi:GNAT family N-acetyltransferase [Paenibacillus sp. MMS20-IR301]|uniref:GNAT family N-acetyltransferase n=1 Tax=Paenibacillus sp. MMS20-IR301 TaxID=2895946 RepID=UPI0028E4B02A|nr:GNAT family N-acetyltransferase [Paenibacillus sp. MMS20-IR301]WNS42001.1 GNAT family N-acetyltransferase [Paenibacillus sp. MMS20-IR301]
MTAGTREHLAAFIHTCNTSGQKCGYTGSTLEDIIHDLSEGLEESSFVLYEGEQIAGAVILDQYEVGGGQQDVEVWGPYYSDHPKANLEPMFLHLAGKAEAEDIRYFHLFISADNTLLLEYAARYRTEKVNTHYHYSADTAEQLHCQERIELEVLPLNGSGTEWLQPLTELHNQGFPGAVFTPEDIEDELGGSGTGEYEIFAVLQENIFTGYMIIRRNALTGVLHLEYICLAPEARSRGFGRQLIHDLAAKYRPLGYTRLELVVSGGNTEAIRFYDTNGFRRDSVMKHVIISGGMELDR